MVGKITFDPYPLRVAQNYATIYIRNYFRKELGCVVIRTPTTADQLAFDLEQVYSMDSGWRYTLMKAVPRK